MKNSNGFSSENASASVTLTIDQGRAARLANAVTCKKSAVPSSRNPKAVLGAIGMYLERPLARMCKPVVQATSVSRPKATVNALQTSATRPQPRSLGVSVTTTADEAGSLVPGLGLTRIYSSAKTARRQARKGGLGRVVAGIRNLLIG